MISGLVRGLLRGTSIGDIAGRAAVDPGWWVVGSRMFAPRLLRTVAAGDVYVIDKCVITMPNYAWSGLAVEVANLTNNQEASPNTTLTEIPGPAGTVQTITAEIVGSNVTKVLKFPGNATSQTMTAGATYVAQLATTDISGSGGEQVIIRTASNWGSGVTRPAALPAFNFNPSGLEGSMVSSSDLSAKASETQATNTITASSNVTTFRPTAIFTQGKPKGRAAVLVFGDSLTEGLSEAYSSVGVGSTGGAQGALVRALEANGIGVMNYAKAGGAAEKMANLTQNATKSWYYMDQSIRTVATALGNYPFTHVITAMLQNDMTSVAATVQSRLTTFWALARAYGKPLLHIAKSMKTNSTNGWVDPSDQNWTGTTFYDPSNTLGTVESWLEDQVGTNLTAAINTRQLWDGTPIVVARGSGYAANDQITLSNGAVIKVLTVKSGGVFNCEVVTNHSSVITGTLTQTATTGSGTGFTCRYVYPTAVAATQAKAGEFRSGRTGTIAAATAGATTVTITGFTPAKGMVITLGQGTASLESRLITAVSGQVATVAALTNAHSTGGELSAVEIGCNTDGLHDSAPMHQQVATDLAADSRFVAALVA